MKDKASKLSARQKIVMDNITTDTWTNLHDIEPEVYLRTIWSLRDKGYIEVKMEGYKVEGDERPYTKYFIKKKKG